MWCLVGSLLALLGASPALAEDLESPEAAEEDAAAMVPGTAPAALVLPETTDIEWHWPVYGRVSSHFGWRRDPKGRGRRMHTGVDIAAAPGRTVRAAGKGLVRFAGRAADYGLMVEIQHPDGHRTRYAHMNAVWVKRGATLEGGDPIGVVGNTGRSTGPHLHFELREGRKPVDPAVIAINFAEPIDARAEQKGPLLRVPGLPPDRVAGVARAALSRVHSVTVMVWDWWS